MKNKIISAIIIGSMLLTAVSGCSETNTAISISDTLSVAERYLSEMKYEQAIIEFDKILSVEPKNADAYLGKAEAYIGLGDHKSAADVLGEAVEKADNLDYNKIIELADMIIENVNNIAAAYLAKARALMYLGDIAAAAAVLQMGYDFTGNAAIKSMLDELSGSDERLNINTENTLEETVIPDATEERDTSYDLYLYSYTPSDDTECLEIEQDIVDHLMNGDPIDKSRLENVTGLGIAGSELVFVEIDGIRCGKDYNWYKGGSNAFGYAHEISSHETVRYSNDFETSYRWGKSIELSFLNDMPNLKKLGISCCDDFDLNQITCCSDLVQLDLSYCRNLKDISSVSKLTNLRVLNLFWDTGVTDISPISNLKKLEYLKIEAVEYHDVNALEGLNNIRCLELRLPLIDNNGYIPDIAPVYNMKKMKHISITDCAYIDMNALSELTDLEEIYFLRCGIKDISPLKELGNLRILDLEDNKITDISGLYGHPNLRAVNINEDGISEADIDSLENSLPKYHQWD